GMAVEGEVLERLRLDLADALARDPQLPADRLERLRVGIAVQAVTEPDDSLLALRQLGDRLAERLLLQAVGDLLLRRTLVAADELAERALVARAHRLVEARDRAGRLPHLAHLLQRQLRPLRQLLFCRRAAELREQLPLG